VPARLLASFVVIRNAVLHLLNEQPLLADLPAEPSPGDVALVCTNLRTVDGKRPFFVDGSDSLFVFPLTQLRFVEVPAASLAGGRVAGRTPDVASAPTEGSNLPATVPPSAPPQEADDLELDEDLLRRVREL
jgi:hypothetical protein